jgi:hypothetical protein
LVLTTAREELVVAARILVKSHFVDELKNAR